MKNSDRSDTIRHVAVAVAAALAFSLAGATQPAAAQDLFEALFGRMDHRRPAMPPHVRSYAPAPPGYDRPRYAPPGYIGPPGYGGPRYGHDNQRPSRDTAANYGGGTAFCVRTCDGRFFPIQRRAGVSTAELCKSFCPASTTMVFSGSRIDHAVAPNGQRYASLRTAFLYRDKMVENCTCNGKDPLGLARVDVEDDPTLRPGDIVATNEGLTTYRGRNAKTAAFTPIDPSKGEWARRLSEIKVRPAPPRQQADVPSADETVPLPRKDGRRAQLSR